MKIEQLFSNLDLSLLGAPRFQIGLGASWASSRKDRASVCFQKSEGSTSVAILRLSRDSFVLEEKAKCLTQSA